MVRRQNMMSSERRSKARKKDSVQSTGSFGGTSGDPGMIRSLMAGVSLIVGDTCTKLQLWQRALVACWDLGLNVDISLKIYRIFLRNVRFRISKEGRQCAVRPTGSKPISTRAAFLSESTGVPLIPHRKDFERFRPIRTLCLSAARAAPVIPTQDKEHLYPGAARGQTEYQRSYPAFLPVRWATAVSSRSPRVGKHAYSFPHAWENCFANRG